MPLFGSSRNIDLSNHNVLLNVMEETVKLRLQLTERWINSERLLSFLDANRDGKITYDEFYDGLSQFGLSETIDLDKVFSYMDNDQKGYVPIEDMLEALRLHEGDDMDESRSPLDEGILPDFPETLLVGLVAHNNLKVSCVRMRR